MQRTLYGLLLVLACSSAHATLLFRSGGLAYYDTTTNLTWVADANLAKTSGYDADGRMNWTTAVTWTASLNAQNAGRGYAGVNSWRLPKATDTGLPGCETLAFFGTDCGWNVALSASEMGRMFSSTLGNTGFYNALGVPTGVCSPTTPFCLLSTGPFSNLQPDRYWSGTVYALDASIAWEYVFRDGRQQFDDMVVSHYAWAVADGDVVDEDGDGVAFPIDNCTLVANPTQLDADSDGYGNICDADLNNSGTVTTSDFGILRSVLNQSAGASATAAAADLNGSGTVTTADFAILRARLNTAPGPSGRACAGTIPCP